MPEVQRRKPGAIPGRGTAPHRRDGGSIPTSVTLPRGLHAALHREAERQNRSASSLAALILAEWFGAPKGRSG
jgi:hypothetical protein